MATTRSPRTRLGWALAGAAFLCLVLAAPTAAATGTSNHGTVKVQEDSDTGNPSNNPHVGCTFSVEGFNMAATSGTLTVKSWPPNDDAGAVVLTDNWTADADDMSDDAGDDSGDADDEADLEGDEDDKDGSHFVAGPYTLPDGHYKVFASNAPEHDKTKVFWVDCEEAEIPVFPSTMALALAGVGGLGGTWAILRRR